MKRWILLVLALFVVLVGIVFSAINAQSVTLDLYAFSFSLPLGIAVLGSLFLGCLLGGTVLYAGVIVPLRLRSGALRREIAKRDAPGTKS
jgi:uncharacterized integral membrane protein